MPSPTDQLEARFRKLAQIDHALTYLSWDQMVMMPPDGSAGRADAIAELAGIHHEGLTSAEVADWFAEAEAESTGEQAGHAMASLREMRRTWQQAVALPADLVKAKIRAGAACEQAWRTQRAANDWIGFLPNFREVVRLSREEAHCRQQADPQRLATPYDALLDLHCAGDSSALVDEVFLALGERLPPLLQEVQGQVVTFEAGALDGQFPVPAQRKLSEQLAVALGFDLKAGRLDESMHPFSTGMAGDLRITTRYRSDEFVDALQSTAHETGHASYEGGLPVRWAGLPIGQARNMCIHESQSVLFERHILMSTPFCEFLMPLVQQHLPAAAHLSAARLQAAWHRVVPGFIRVEADEITYSLHVMLRHGIERDLINGQLEPDQVPEAWDAGMQRYLGLSTAGNYKDGCLQDIHWTDGAFGYFPSYTLGSVNAAQLMNTVRRQFPDWPERFAAGDTAFLRKWLSNHIWQRGSELESQALMKEATGEGTHAQHLIEHLEARYLRHEY